MPDFWTNITGGFMPHGYCLRWDGPLLFVFIAGNLGIAIAYFVIPAALRFFIGKRKDLPYPYMFKLFAAFILSCGITHIAKVWTLYQPAYWIEAGLDLWTAGVSLVTAFLLLPLIPKALSLRSPRELDEANSKLEKSNAGLESANEELLVMKNRLEEAVKARTTELETVVQQAKDKEAQFRMLFDMMPQLGWTAQADGFIDFYNQGWYDYTGSKFEEMQGWGWQKVHDPTLLGEVEERWREAIRTQTPFEMTFPIRRNDGVFRSFLTRINPIRNEQGKLIRWVGINTDIQDEMDRNVALERAVQERTTELRLAKDEAVAANEAKSRFLSTVSHEVRTPLAGVIGMVEMMHVSVQDENINKMSKIALEACKRLLQILNDLLDASKLQAGAVKLEYRYFSVRPILGDIVQLINAQAEKKSLEISSTVAPEVPEFVCGDELRVRQILQNLAFNAVKFTQQGRVEISVEVLQKESNKTTLKFSIKDTGIGISEEQQKKIFEPFVQADDSTTRVYGGTGLGLSITRTLVDLMEGEIGLKSTIKEGSLFWVVIPFRDDLCQTG